jgi:aldose 1-epimerase
VKGTSTSDALCLRITGEDGEATATISTRAASLRTLEVGGLALVEPTSQMTDLSGMAGAVMAPWPNRVEDAAWWYEGQRLQLPANEPELSNAIHGLLTQNDFEVRRRGIDFVQLTTEIDPQPGYPFALEVDVRYRVHRDGLNARIEVTNRSARVAPVAVGVHPYLRLGDVPLDRLHVSIDADRVWQLDQRNLPSTSREVRGTDEDPWEPHLVAAGPEHALYRRSHVVGRALVHALSANDGLAVELWAESRLPWTQLYVAPDLMTDEGPRRAVAIEPMSAPPNALRSGVDLHYLPRDGRRAWRWAIRLRQPESRIL